MVATTKKKDPFLQSRWLRYGRCHSEILEKMISKSYEIRCDDPLDVLAVCGSVGFYYLDIALDALVAWGHWQAGDRWWAAICASVLFTFLFVRTYQPRGVSEEAQQSQVQNTSVFMIPWYAIFDKKTDDEKTRQEVFKVAQKAIESEGLFEAPTQLTFQLYVIIYKWGNHGQPDFVQYVSIFFSIISLAHANATVFDKPYALFLHSLGGGTSSLSLLLRRLPPLSRIGPFIVIRGLQLVSRIVALSLIPIVLGPELFVIALCALLGVRFWMFRRDREDDEDTPPQLLITFLIGSMFSDGFFGDVHFREHINSPPAQCKSQKNTQKKWERGEARRQALEEPSSEVSKEAMKVMQSIVWMTTESYLCFLLALLKIEALGGFEFDPYIVGRMALAVAACWLLRGVSMWFLHYSPTRELSAPASTMLPRLFVAYLALTAGCASIVLFTGVDSDSCYGAECGSGGECIPLTGTYACECYDGYGKTPPRTMPRDTCHDINECASFSDTCGVRNVCKNTDGAYECEDCEEGYAAFGDRSVCEVDVCFDGQLLGTREKTFSPIVGQHVDSLTVLGDMDKDGMTDIAAGSGHFGDGGAAFVVFLNPNRMVKSVVTIDSSQGGLVGPLRDGDAFGNSVAGLGDVDGDGVMDMAVGAYRDNDAGEDRGSVYVLLMYTNGTVKSEQKLSSTKGGLMGPLGDGDMFGSSVASVGDLDGDGVGDLVAGAIGDDDGGWGRGAVYVLRLLPTGAVKGEQKISSTVGGLVGPLQDNNLFGQSATGIGDLDGDGVPDLVVGSHDADGGVGRGAVYVLLLKTDGSVKGEQKISSSQGGLEGPLDDGDRFGQSVTSIGDLNGDGVSDLVVGADGDDDGGQDKGAAYVMLMQPNGMVKAEQKLSADQGGLVSPLNYDDQFGSALAGLVDLDEDGFMDLVGVAQDVVYMFVVPAGFVRTDDNAACAGDVCFGVDCGTGSCVPGIGKPFKCICGPGFTHDSPSLTESPCNSDVDECEVDNGGCDQVCINRAPGSSCWCDPGYYLNDDGVSCTEIDASALICENSLLPGEQKLSSPQRGVVGPLYGRGHDFGTAVAVIGDLNADGVTDLAVCAQGDVYILFLNLDGTTRERVKITGVVGVSVAGIGDVNGDGFGDLAVGYGEDDDGGSDYGAVFVVQLLPNGSGKVHKISWAQGGLLADLDAFDNFGAAVAGLGDLDGDGVVDLAVGTPGDDDGGTNRGAVYILLLDEYGTVKKEHKIGSKEGGGLTTLSGENTRFGAAVAGVGDMDGDQVVDLVVGSNRNEDTGVNEGAVYVLLLLPTGGVKSEQKVSATQGGLVDGLAEFGRFGWSITGMGDLDGDGVVDLAVGAARDDVDGRNSGQGTVYVLLMNPEGSVKRSQRINSKEGGMVASIKKGGFFGSSLAAVQGTAGDRGVLQLFVGAPGDGDGGRTSGAVYVLRVPLGVVDLCDMDERTICVAGNHGNYSCDADVNFCDTSNGGCDQLCFHTYLGPECGCDQGYVLNSDGTSCNAMDMFCSPGMVAPGSVKISHTRGGPALTDNDRFGYSVTAIGDLDGDDIGDMVVGAPGSYFEGGAGITSPGAVYVLFMDATGHMKEKQKISSTEGGLKGLVQDDDLFGASVAGGWDFNDDGLVDLVVGAPLDDDGATDTGAVYVLLLNGDGTVKSEQKISSQHSVLGGLLDEGDEFGWSVAIIGDLDGNGFADLVVGAPGDDHTKRSVDIGAVYVLFMLMDGTFEVVQKINFKLGGLQGDVFRQSAIFFGYSVGSTGDLNGDEIPDMVVGAPGNRDGGSSRGAVYVLFMQASGSVQSQQRISSSWGGLKGPILNGDFFGSSVGTIGDLDNNGVVDLVVGAAFDDTGGENRGAVYVLLMTSSGTVKWEQKITPSSQLGTDLFEEVEGAGYMFGRSLAGLGDLNGDGVVELVVGASGDDDAGPNRGAVYVLKVPPGFVSLCGVRECQMMGGHADYTCGRCDPGFVVDESVNGICTDVDECAEGTHDCKPTEICHNSPGSHYCLGPESTCGGSLFAEQKIGAVSGGLVGPLQNNQFGGSVDVLGDVDGDGVLDLVVGARKDNTFQPMSGAVFILFMNPDRTVRAESKITAYVNQHQEFGLMVNAVGDVNLDGVGDIVVMSEMYTKNKVDLLFLTPEGELKERVSVYTTETPPPVHWENVWTTWFGRYGSTRLGDLDEDGVPDIAIGTPQFLDGTGGVHIMFMKSDGSVKEERLIKNTHVSDREDSSHFGLVRSVGDLNGDGRLEIGVGSPNEYGGSGAVYIIFLNKDGSVQTQHKISREDGWPGSPLRDMEFFSAPSSVGDLNGDGVMDISVSTYADGDGGVHSGAVYILLLTSNFTVKAHQKISATQGGLAGPLEAWDEFGVGGAAYLGDMDGDGVTDIAVGARRDDDGHTNAGAVYILGIPPGYVNECSHIDECVPTAESLVASDYTCRCPFGLVLSENKLNGNGLVATLLEAHDRFGASVTSVGDLDGNGITDIAVVSARAADEENGLSATGFATVILLDSDQRMLKEQKVSTGGEGEPRVVKSVASMGDLDGDGVGELMVACQVPAALYVEFLKPDGGVKQETMITPHSIGVDGTTEEDLGREMAGVGDLDGDTVPDMVVGAPGSDAGRGAVYLLFMHADGSVKGQRKIGRGDAQLSTALEEDDNFGSGVAGLGDLDGDGVPELAVSAERDDDGGVDRGAVYVLFFNQDWTLKHVQKISSTQGGLMGPVDDHDRFGRVSEVGDLNGDGLMDLVVGARGDDDGRVADSGALHVLLLNGDGTVKDESKISATEGGFMGPLDDGEKADLFGASVSFLGEMGEGIGVVVGVPGDDDTGVNTGAVYILELRTCAFTE